jgi:drug/metabolite transporter superfamily protein YnfA
MKTALLYASAAFAEIAGCFAFWAWAKAPGMKTPARGVRLRYIRA